jgi:serine phosphatase RsbU (regulator of sigma subunit)
VLVLGVVLAWLVVAVAGWLRASRQVAYGFIPHPPGDGRPGLMVYLNTTLGVSGSYSGLHNGDRILAVDGVSAADGDAFHQTFWRARRPGDRLDLVVQRAAAFGGGTDAVAYTLEPPLTLPDILLVHVVAGVASVAGLAVALLVFLARPKTPAATPLVISAVASAWVDAGITWSLVPEEQWLWVVRAYILLALVVYTAWLHLFMVFPAPYRLERRLRSLGPAFVSWAGAGMLLFYAAPLVPPAVTIRQPLGDWVPLPSLLGILLEAAALVVLVRNYRRAAGPLVRAQLKWIVLALSLLWVSTIGVVAVFTIQPEAPPPVALAVLYVMNVAYYVSLALAVFRYRLFDVDQVVRHALIYGAITAVLVGGFILATLVGSQVMVALAGPRAGDNPVIAVVAALALAAAAAPLRRRLQVGIDRLVYRARVARRAYLAEAGEVLRRALPLDQLTAFLTAETRQRLRLTGAWLALPPPLRTGADTSVLVPAGGDADALLARLRPIYEPVLLTFEDLSASGVGLLPPDDPALRLWHAAGARLLVPLRSGTGERATPVGASESQSAAGEQSAGAGTPAGDTLVGVWALGVLPGGALPDRADLRAVARVGQQAAVLLDYARLSAEQVRQAVLAQDLVRAREIQVRLLPHNIPGWAGRLEIAARLHPARETSGDFYDVFVLEGRERAERVAGEGATGGVAPLQIAVGDVQGKGLGAALVMALAQATLRTAAHECYAAVPEAVVAGLGATPEAGGPAGAPAVATGAAAARILRRAPSPATTLSLAGNLLHRSVRRRDFVAAALVVVEPPAAGEAGPLLRLANAAQVPPLLCRDGTVTELVPGGEALPLGVLDTPRYRELRLDLRPGDFVVFATDGLAEAPARRDLPARTSAGHSSAAVGTGRVLAPPAAPGEVFGFERTAAAAGFWASHAHSAAAVLDGLWHDVTAWCGEDSSHDDMTLVVLHVPR